MQNKILFSFIITLSNFLIATSAKAQEVNSTSGGEYGNANYKLTYTIGEPNVTTLINSNMQLTQGFQQPVYQIIISLITKIADELNIKIFPNPTTDILFLSIEKPPQNLQFMLFDMSGKLLQQKNITDTKTEINMQAFSNANYVLQVLQNQEKISSYEIIKK